MNIAALNVNISDWNDKPVTVPYFQLLQWRSALKLEAVGMKHSSGKSVYAMLRKMLSAPASFKRADMLRYIDATIADVKEQLGI